MGSARSRRSDDPTPGTFIRLVYDYLLAYRGKPVRIPFGTCKKRVSAIRDLQRFYGLEINGDGTGVWTLAGEWFGARYVDYTKVAKG